MTYFFISRILECKVSHFSAKDKAFITFFAKKSANITFITLKLSNFAPMNRFILTSKYKPTGDQPEAIRQLTDGLEHGDRAQVLLGVTGSGKTFTVANVIANVNRPTLI